MYISPVMFVMAAYFVAVGLAYEYMCSLAAVILHECAHARVAKKLGYELNIIKLMPYGAALCGSVDIRPRDEVFIAAAGPLVNLVVATMFAALWWLFPSSYMFTDAFCMGNLYIGLFNLLPVYPLDGGRILFAALTAKKGGQRAYKTVRVVSAAAGVVAVGLGVLSAFYAFNLCLLSVGIFVTLSAFLPDDGARYRALFSLSARKERLIVSPLEVRRYAISRSAPVSAAISALDPDRYTEFTVYDGDMRAVGKIDETSLAAAVKARGYGINMGDLV